MKEAKEFQCREVSGKGSAVSWARKNITRCKGQNEQSLHRLFCKF